MTRSPILKRIQMAHEMTENDSAVYFKQPAWHGLGNVVDMELSTTEAMKQSGLGWEVEKVNLEVGGAGPEIWAEDYRGILRCDINKVLGIVSPQYKPIQNWEIFDLANKFGNGVKVESAGSVQDGRKGYLLLRGETFATGFEDEVVKYMALMWSHDGSQSLTVVPTSVRVVCKNTLDMVIGQAKNTRNKISISHAGDMEAKMKQAELAIERFVQYGSFFEDTVKSLSSRGITTDGLNNFFAKVYQMMNGPIVTNPTNDKEERDQVHALTTIGSWKRKFDEEANQFGFSYWIAANAVTNNIQHRQASRGRKRTPVSAAYNNLVGQNAKDSRSVFNTALAMSS